MCTAAVYPPDTAANSGVPKGLNGKDKVYGAKPAPLSKEN